MNKNKLLTVIAVILFLGISVVLATMWQNNNRIDNEIITVSKSYQEANPKILSKKQTTTDGPKQETMYLVELQGNFVKDGKAATHLSFSIRARDGFAWSIMTYNTEGSKIVIKETGTASSGSNQKVVGIIYAKDSHIVYEKQDASEADTYGIDTYIEENKARWETTELTYPTGGMTKDGALWDGIAYTDISKDDFLNGLYVELSNNWDGLNFDLQ